MMKASEQKRALAFAVQAAENVGKLLRKHQFSSKKVDFSSQHDIKLELDVRSQHQIQEALLRAFPEVSVVGEEGSVGDAFAAQRWVIDPIDGTVNFTYGIPHACVSIALQERTADPALADYPDGYRTLAGVVYDPFCDEMWTAIRGQPARLNGNIVTVSNRSNLNECIISIGFAKSRENLKATLPYFNQLVHRVRKIRMMGAAALSLTYVATGRFDAYIERGIRLWDIAAGGLILQSAGGEFWHESVDKDYTYRMIASNGQVRRKLRVPSMT